ncbi:MBOAT family O-acyltransferase [Neisseria lisongii]|uniref:Probable alginate O-acetylase AlgI n=1 Tax=Neisseria lisongii TaxID=2912188 RepID=A0AAW5AMN6_9NEIS|nr:MBOAT family protein [Neisseria lisongii]MCF7529188.1 MBOAT family protein [Neisseria lisongii]
MFLLSIEFALFMLAFLPLYWSVAKWPKAQNILLLLAGLGWLVREDAWFALTVTLFSSLIWLIGRLMPSEKTQGGKWLAGFGIVSGLAVLCFFKYFDFFRPLLQQAFGQNAVVDILLPLGLSYYVFQSIAYIVYCYQYPQSERFDWDEVLLHFSFFPTVTSGPIIRAAAFKSIDGIQLGALGQIRTRRPRELVRPALAVALIALGLAKKWWLAGSLAEGWVSPVFANPEQFGGWDVLAAVYGYTFQLFFDFSGYSDLVIGLAMLLGFRLPKNFNAPLRAANIREFWNRWHISLSTWIRDYIYIPLGGSKKGFVRTQLNLLLAMVLSGIWHGYGWNFLLWGVLHGLALVCLNIGDRLIGKSNGLSGLPFCKWLAVAVTFHFVCLTFVVFNTSSLNDTQLVFSALFDNTQGWRLTDWATAAVLALFAAMLLLYPYLIRLFDAAVAGLEKLPLWLWFVPLTLALLVIVVLAPSGIPGFIYANF